MARQVILCSSAWSDLSLENLAQRAGEWGYQGLEVCCWGAHLEVQRALNEPAYCPKMLDILGRFELGVPIISNHRVGQAVCDPVDARHKSLLPDYVWGNGKPDEVSQRAGEEMMATARVAQQLGAGTVSGFTGSALWSYVCGYPPASAETIAGAFKDFARRWRPILNAFGECGVRFAFEVHPGQIAFDLQSAEATLDALDGREEFGFLFDPSHLHWQGLDPVEFLRRFPDRIYHVHVKDVRLNLNGRNGILNSYLAPGHPRRGWDFRSPGRGGIDWEAIIRGLNEIGYDGALSVDWNDPNMNRDFGAEDACRFLKRLDFPGPAGTASGPFTIT
jgi:sugar phosphate isomerase/epimerase